MSRTHKSHLTTELESVLQQSLHAKKEKRVSRSGGAAVVYTRVSSQEQAENNSSLETQLKLCNEYAKRYGLSIKQYFGGTYESAKTDGRKEFLRMLAYVKQDKSISYIIVYNLDRFSRSGAGAMQLSAELRNQGIAVKSVSQEIDSSTPSGRLQESLLHIFNYFDNDTKSERTSTNTREVMLKGYWPYGTPLGYKNLKPKHRACDHQYVITEEGALIRKAFEWKIEGRMTNKEICEELQKRGLKLTEKNFRFVISNPFYAGYITGRLLKGQYVKGHHPPMITLEMFLKANDLLTKAINSSLPKKQKHEDVPLKIFAREVESGSQFTAFKQKGIWYYKARGKDVRMTVNASRMNALFEEYLRQFEYKKEYESRLRKAIEEGLRRRLASALEENVQLKKRISELQGQLEGIEERFVLGQLPADLYEKYASKYRGEVKSLEEQLSRSAFNSSNLKTAVEKGLQIAQNLSAHWTSVDFDSKQKLQSLVFPEGITYSKKIGVVQTSRINALFAAIEPWKQLFEEKEKGHFVESDLLSSKVTASGFKPETF